MTLNEADIDVESDAKLMESITKIHVKLLRDRRTYAMAATVLLGETSLVDDNVCKTAKTNGRDKFFNRNFLRTLKEKQRAYVILHENLHVLLMHIIRYNEMREEDRNTLDAAMDYVVNGIIEELNAPDLLERPEGALFDAKFKGYDVGDVYRFLRTGRQKNGQQCGKPQPNSPPSKGQGNGSPQAGKKPGDQEGKGEPGESENTQTDQEEEQQPTSTKIGGQDYSMERMDEHGEPEKKKGEGQGEGEGEGDGEGQAMSAALTEADIKQLEREIQQIVEQAHLLAGAGAGNQPRQIRDMIIPEIDWREALQEFVMDAMNGDEDVSFRKYDRRHLGHREFNEDVYYPTPYSEKIGEIVMMMDTSGSTFGPVFEEFVGGFQLLLDQMRPERVRVIHWDDGVRSDQVITETEYLSGDLKQILKPVGGGGTNVTKAGNYVVEKQVQADCILVFTDGWLESGVVWRPQIPTMWLVTDRDDWVPPAGKLVKVKRTDRTRRYR